MRIFAVDDGGFAKPHPPDTKKRVSTVAIVTGEHLELIALKIGAVTVDGLDATRQILSVHARMGTDVDAVLLPSITLAGFNIVNIAQIHRKARVPVLVVNPERPDEVAVYKALVAHFRDWEERLAILQRTGSPVPIKLSRGGTVYVQWSGASPSEVSRILNETTVFGNRPEPLRAVRLLAHGLTTPSVQLT